MPTFIFLIKYGIIFGVNSSHCVKVFKIQKNITAIITRWRSRDPWRH